MTTPAGAVAGNAAQVQRDTAAREGQPSGGGFFSKKYGPLPGWGWSLLAAGGALAFFWWRSRNAANAASATDTSQTDTTSSADQADQLAELQDEIDALQGELATSTDNDTGSGSGGGTGGGTGDVTVPKVTGMRATPAVSRLAAAGLRAHSTPARKTGTAQKVASQSPEAGKKVAKGSVVDLHLEKV